MEASIIQVKKLSFSYPKEKERVLEDIDLSIDPGSFTVIIGPSGCGKSTLLKVISGIEKPTRGTVLVRGKTSFVFQSGAILPWRTVEQNVYLAVEMLSIPKEERHQRVRDAIKLMGLYELEKEFPRNLSGGQRQRVGIARALATKPDILFLDEPFSALDPETTEHLHKELKDIWKKNGMTIVMVSHSMDEASLLGQEVIIMDEGKIKRTITRDITPENLRLALGKSESTLRS